MTPLIPAVAYYRMSSDKQEASIADQRVSVSAYALKLGYAIVREYRDEAISGDATERRVGFQQMLADVKRADFRAVLCWDQDRFGRFDPLEAGYWIKPMRDAGIVLVTVGQGVIDWNSFAGRLVYSVHQEGKQQFLIDLSRNVVARMAERAKKGYFLGGQAPFGYRAEPVPGFPPETKKIPRRLVLGTEADVQAVRWLFETYATRDVGLQWLAAELKRRGVRPPGIYRKVDGKVSKVRRDDWTPQTIRAMLRNRVYLGEARWNAVNHGGYHGLVNGEVTPWANRTGGKEQHVGRKASMRPAKAGTKGRIARVIRERNVPEDVQVVPKAHPAIVDQELFDRVGLKLVARRRRTTPYVGGGDFLLSGLLICGHCGASMFGSTNKKHAREGKRWTRYTCSTYHSRGHGACTCNWVDEDAMVKLLLATIRKLILNPSNVQMSQQRAEELRQQAANTLPAERIELQRRATALARDYKQGIGRLALIPDELLSDYRDAMMKQKAELDGLQERLAALENPPEAIKAEEQAKQDGGWLWQLESAAESGDPADLRAFFGSMLEKVECFFAEVEPAQRKTAAKWHIKRMRFNRACAHIKDQRRLTLNSHTSKLGNAETAAFSSLKVFITGQAV